MPSIIRLKLFASTSLIPISMIREANKRVSGGKNKRLMKTEEERAWRLPKCKCQNISQNLLIM